MAELSPGMFTSWNLSPEEAVQGSILSLTQTQVLENELCRLAEEKILLEYDPEHATLYARDEAYKRGQIQIIQWLLANSEAAMEAATIGQ